MTSFDPKILNAPIISKKPFSVNLMECLESFSLDQEQNNHSNDANASLNYNYIIEAHNLLTDTMTGGSYTIGYYDSEDENEYLNGNENNNYSDSNNEFQIISSINSNSLFIINSSINWLLKINRRQNNNSIMINKKNNSR